MKNIKFLSLILLTWLAASCNPDGKGNLPDLERVPIPKITVAANSDVLIQEPTAFKGKFTVDMLFPEDIAPRQVDVVVARNGDYGVTKVLQANVTSFPTTVDVDAAKLAQLFGLDITKVIPGDYFEIGATVITQSGFTVPAFTKTYNQYSADVANFPGSSLRIKYPVVCPLDMDDFVGEFTIYDPNFWEGNYPVTVTREGENVLAIKGFVEDPEAVIKVTVDPKTTKIAVPSQVFAASFIGYTNGKVAGTGEINACANSITLNLAYSVDQGSFGSFGLTIAK